MGNSPLTEYTRISPNNSGRRTMEIDRITPHCIVGQVSAESLCEWFSHPSTQASSNYGIDKDARVCVCVNESDRAWTSSSNANDQRAVTIECACDKDAPNAFKDIVYSKLVDLCVDICQRHGKKTLLWIPDRDTALNKSLKSDEMLLTVHRWFSNTDCPGEWMMARMGDLAARVTARLGGTETTQKPAQTPAQTTPQAFIEAIAPACVADMKETGVLASVTIAQACLETGFGQSELAQKAHNLFGMKCMISGNSWPGSTWAGLPYRKKTSEYDAQTGQTYETYALFRAYDNDELSIRDHGAYLTGARNGNRNRYEGIVGETDPATVCDILTAGGYATSPEYKASLLDLIKRYDLTQYDRKTSTRTQIPVTLEQVRQGDECQSVWVLRTMLRGRDYKTESGKRLTRSKQFDSDCDFCVRAFQAKHKLDVDGICGPKTWHKLLGV